MSYSSYQGYELTGEKILQREETYVKLNFKFMVRFEI